MARLQAWKISAGIVCLAEPCATETRWWEQEALLSWCCRSSLLRMPQPWRKLGWVAEPCTRRVLGALGCGGLCSAQHWAVKLCSDAEGLHLLPAGAPSSSSCTAGSAAAWEQQLRPLCFSQCCRNSAPVCSPVAEPALPTKRPPTNSASTFAVSLFELVMAPVC